MNGITRLLFLLLLSFTLFADDTVWNYDLTYLPDGWSTDSNWVFTPTGASISIYAAGNNYEHDEGSIYTATIMIPDNCDSVIIHADQEIFSGYQGEGGASAMLRYCYNDQVWHSNYIGGPITTDPIHLSIPPIPGQGLTFWFHATVSGGSFNHYGMGSVDWDVSDLTLTFYGDAMAFSQSTWAGIKTTFNR